RSDQTAAVQTSTANDAVVLALTTRPILVGQCPLPRRRFRAIGEGAPCVVRKSWWKVQRQGALQHLLPFGVAFPNLEFSQQRRRLIDTRLETYRFVEPAFGGLHGLTAVFVAHILGICIERGSQNEMVLDQRGLGIGVAHELEIRNGRSYS